VNYVGVDLNTASIELLAFVSGITQRCQKTLLPIETSTARLKSPLTAQGAEVSKGIRASSWILAHSP